MTRTNIRILISANSKMISNSNSTRGRCMNCIALHGNMASKHCVNCSLQIDLQHRRTMPRNFRFMFHAIYAMPCTAHEFLFELWGRNYVRVASFATRLASLTKLCETKINGPGTWLFCVQICQSVTYSLFCQQLWNSTLFCIQLYYTFNAIILSAQLVGLVGPLIGLIGFLIGLIGFLLGLSGFLIGLVDPIRSLVGLVCISIGNLHVYQPMNSVECWTLLVTGLLSTIWCSTMVEELLKSGWSQASLFGPLQRYLGLIQIWLNWPLHPSSG